VNNIRDKKFQDWDTENSGTENAGLENVGLDKGLHAQMRDRMNYGMWDRMREVVCNC